jgi:sugar phosphate isomerase/epimerase
MRTDQIALQLYTVRDDAQKDMTGTLRRLAQVGYRAVELAGYGNSTAPEVRSTLDELGMRVVASHVGLDRLEQDAALDELETLGCRYAVVPWIPEEQRRPASALRQLVGRINRAAERARERGFVLAYHNHDFEFAPLDGTDFFQILTDEIDPDLVKLEIDVFWVKYAGRDPVELIRRHTGRVPLLHIKDMAPGDTRGMAVVGEGAMPWPEILQAGESADTEWYVIEHDNPSDALRDVERALRNLEGLATE